MVHTQRKKGLAKAGPKSHQRSWWMVHTQPKRGLAHAGPKSHQRSWWMVHTQPKKGLAHAGPKSHHAVGGWFILSLKKGWRMPFGIPPSWTTETAELAP